MRYIVLSVILLFSGLSLSGCLAMRQAGLEPQYLEPSQKLRFDDIPYPSGFRVLADKSFILESGGVRAGMLKYAGRARVEEVVSFYKSQMPRHNWALLNVLEYGDHMLNFERENESCVITLRARGRRVDIAVSLAPKSPMRMPQKRIERGEPLRASPVK